MSKMSISVVKGRGSMAHNNREFTTPNVDQERIPNNITYRQESLEQAYQKLFQNEVDRYNMGKKPCRQIPNYIEHIRNSGNGEKLFYETVVQVGDKFSCPCGSQQGEIAKKILDDYMHNFEKRNPNLYVFNAVMHLDEATPHLHIDYIPVAHGYQKGLQIRNSLDKALKEQGIDGKSNKQENSTHNWQESEKKQLEEIMMEYGIERKPEKGIQRAHMSVDQYKAIAEQIHNQVREMPKQIEVAPMMLNKNRVTVEASDLEQLEQRAKLSLIHEKATQRLEQGMNKVSNAGQQYIENTKSLLAQELHFVKNERIMGAQERKKALELKEKYLNLYKSQESLNDHYKQLNDAYEQQSHIITSLQAENRSLKAQISELKQVIEEKVRQAVEPLKEAMQSMAQTTRNVICAVSWINRKFKEAELNEVCDAVQDYGKKWLEADGFPELAETANEPELSKGIKNRLIPKYDEIVYYKGKQGYGFYSSKAEGGQYLGDKKDYDVLKKTFPNSKFKDPHEHVPQISGDRYRVR